MKKSFLLLIVLGFCVSVFAQTKTKSTTTKTSSKTSTAKKTVAKKPVAKLCPPLVVDLTAGTVNGLTPDATMAKVKAKLPCFTGETAEGSDFNCGGGVFYLNQDIFFYSKLDAIEVRGKYKGKFLKEGKEVKLIGITSDELLELMGEPDEDTETDEDNYVNMYELENGGTVRVMVEDGKVVQVSLHTQGPLEIEICE